MIYLQRTAFALGTAGLERDFGRPPRPYWLMIANDQIQGNPTGTPVVVDWYDPTHSQDVVPYGSVKRFPLRAYLFRVSGNGAVIELTCSDDPIDLEVQTVTLSADGAGLAKAAQLPAILIGGNALSISVQDPPQVNVTGGKAVPVKTET